MNNIKEVRLEQICQIMVSEDNQYFIVLSGYFGSLALLTVI